MVKRILNKDFELQECLKALLEECDGAEKRDKKGFNKLDSPIAHQYSMILQTEWSEEQKGMIYRMLKKYSKQLLTKGVVYDELPYWYLGSKF